jgi:hypothetical protein
MLYKNGIAYRRKLASRYQNAQHIRFSHSVFSRARLTIRQCKSLQPFTQPGPTGPMLRLEQRLSAVPGVEKMD